MKNFRMSKGVIEHYTSLAELREAWGLPVVIKQTKDKEKLKKQRENFCNYHKCRACGNPMTYIGGSVMVCTNEKCRGIPLERKDDEGNVKVTYLTSYEILDDKYVERAENIFYEAN